MMQNANKLSPSLKMELLDESQQGRAVDSDQLNLLVQVAGPLTDEQRAQLEAVNAEVRTEAGDVLTVTLPAAELQNLIALDFVVYIELSSPLSPESGSP